MKSISDKKENVNDSNTIFNNSSISLQNILDEKWLLDIRLDFYPSGLIVYKPSYLGYGREDIQEFKRGKIRGFTRESRNRMIKLLSTVLWDSVSAESKNALYGRAFFVTLTYGSKYPEDKETLKNNLNAFLMQVYRKIDSCGVIWKLELQLRGAPHFHLVLFFDDEYHVNDVRKVCLHWHKITENSKWLHVTTVYQAEGKEGRLVSYLNKYMGKMFDNMSSNDYGRFWGVRNKEHIPLGPVSYMMVDKEDKELVMRDMKRALPKNTYVAKKDGRTSFNAFVDINQMDDVMSKIDKYQNF